MCPVLGYWGMRFGDIENENYGAWTVVCVDGEYLDSLDDETGFEGDADNV